MTRRDWKFAFLVSLFLGIVLLPLYANLSLWIGFGIAGVSVLLVNMAMSARFILPLPQLILFIGFLQLILAAWVNQYFPTHAPHFDIGDRISTYLDFAGPACIALAVGIFLPLRGQSDSLARTRTSGGRSENHPALVRELKILLIVGIAAHVMRGFLPGSIRFVGELLSLLPFVAVFGMMLIGHHQWKLFAALILGLTFFESLKGGSFHDLLLWLAMFILILARIRKWGRKVLWVLMLGFLGLFVLQAVKEEYRDQFWYGKFGGYSDNRVLAFGQISGNILLEPGRIFDDEHVAAVVGRFNQGWIVNRVMIWTPDREPYANGETLVRSVQAIVPRFLMPDKPSTAGRVDFERFTGHRLFGGASMGLGYAGEMYANFGYWGGLLGVGLYGLVLGIGFRYVTKMSQRSVLWWAWGAYLFVIAIKAESSVGFVFNWTLKSIVIMWVILMVSPAMRQSMFRRPRKLQKSNRTAY